MLYILYYESANYAGYGEHAIVQADSEEEAQELCEGPMNDWFYEQDGDQYQEDYGDDCDGGWASMIRCEELTKDHESAEFVTNPNQESIYHCINIDFKDIPNLL